MAGLGAVGQERHGAGDLKRLSGEIASVFRRAWGRGPLKTTVRWAGADVLIVLMEDGHNQAEQTLRAAGHLERLTAGRALLQAVIEDDLIAAVESSVGRRVGTMLSATRVDPDLSAQIFLLEPGGPAAPVSIGDRAREVLERSHELGEESEALAEHARQLQRRRCSR